MSISFCAVLGQHPTDVPGGAEFQADLIARELAARGHEAHYVAHSADQRSRTEEEGVTIHRLGGTGGEATVDTLASIDADVYYFRIVQDLPTLWRAKRRLDATFVYNVSRDVQCEPLLAAGPYSDDKGVAGRALDTVRYAAYRLLLRVPDEVFAQTEHQRSLLAEHHGIDATLVGNGHPVPEVGAGEQSPPVVLWLANLKSVKHPGPFLRLSEALHDVDAEFWMVGRPVDEELAATVRETAAAVDGLSYLGGCDVEESNEFFSRATVYVHTGDTEGYPNTFIQSWLRGTPVVSLCTNPDGTLDRHDVGVHCSSEDELRAAVRGLLEDPDRRAAVAASAREYAVANHSIEAVVDRVETRLADLVE